MRLTTVRYGSFDFFCAPTPQFENGQLALVGWSELAIADSFVAVLQRLDALAELLAHDLELREDMRGLPDKFRTLYRPLRQHSRFACQSLPSENTRRRSRKTVGGSAAYTRLVRLWFTTANIVPKISTVVGEGICSSVQSVKSVQSVFKAQPMRDEGSM